MMLIHSQRKNFRVLRTIGLVGDVGAGSDGVPEACSWIENLKPSLAMGFPGAH